MRLGASTLNKGRSLLAMRVASLHLLGANAHVVRWLRRPAVWQSMPGAMSKVLSPPLPALALALPRLAPPRALALSHSLSTLLALISNIS